MTQTNTLQHFKPDERNHVEKPLFDQLRDLDREIIDLTDEKRYAPAPESGSSFFLLFTAVQEVVNHRYDHQGEGC